MFLLLRQGRFRRLCLSLQLRCKPLCLSNPILLPLGYCGLFYLLCLLKNLSTSLILISECFITLPSTGSRVENATQSRVSFDEIQVVGKCDETVSRV